MTETAQDPEQYIALIDDPARRADVAALDAMIRDEAPELARHMYGSMLGYGTYHYRYATGRTGEAALIALASQKRYISLYCGCTDAEGYLAERYSERLPRANIGRSCVRFTRLSDVDADVLRELVRESAKHFADNPDFAVVN